ncbi:MAG: META domain-containing protein [Deltaproteobacteria bacterium]
MTRAASIVVTFLVAAGWADLAHAANATWLDTATPKAWNKPGAKLSLAPHLDPDPFLEKKCSGDVRAPVSDADRAVAAAGWKLIGASVTLGDTEVVMARSGSDGMCRPLGYQAFVFSGGRFAGTLSLRPMDSRSDGSAQTPRLLSASSLSASFARYSPKDPLCCPSRISTVQYRIDATPKGPVVTPVSVATVATDPLDPGSAAAGPGPAGRLWQLARMRMKDGAVVVPGDPARYTLELSADGNASTQADCNRGRGTYKLEGASLSIGTIATTRAICPPGSISEPYLRQLGLVSSWAMTDGKLLLTTSPDGAALEFDAAPAPAGQLR